MGKLKWKQMGNNLVLLIVIRGNGTIYIFETKGVNTQDEKYSTRIFWDGHVRAYNYVIHDNKIRVVITLLSY